MNIYYQAALSIGMIGLVLITVAAASHHMGIWRTEGEDPIDRLLKNSALIGLGLLLVIWAAIVAPLLDPR